MSTLPVPQRPPMCDRKASSSSFADAFDDARRRLDEMGVHEPESDEEEALSPVPSSGSSAVGVEGGLASPADTVSPASPATPVTVPITPMADANGVADNFAFAFDIDG